MYEKKPRHASHSRKKPAPLNFRAALLLVVYIFMLQNFFKPFLSVCCKIPVSVMPDAVVVPAVFKSHLFQRLADACLYRKPALVAVCPGYKAQMCVFHSVFFYAFGIPIKFIRMKCCCRQFQMWVKCFKLFIEFLHSSFIYFVWNPHRMDFMTVVRIENPSAFIPLFLTVPRRHNHFV